MTSEPKNHSSYSSGLATRESILAHALTLVAETGYRGLSLRDLGRKVGISHPAVIYHFPSKIALLQAIITRLESVFQLIKTATDDESDELMAVGLLPQTLPEYSVALMRLVKYPDIATYLNAEFALLSEATEKGHPAHQYYTDRLSIIKGFLAQQFDSRGGDGASDVLFQLPEDKAEFFIRYWYGQILLNQYEPGSDCAKTPFQFMTLWWHVLDLSADEILDIGEVVSDDIADVYSRALKIYRSFER